MLLQLYKKYHLFIKYCAIAGLGFLLDYGAFFLLFNILGLNQQIAQIVGSHLGFINNFLWNAFANFKQTDKLAKRFISYYLTSLMGTALRALSLLIFVSYFAFNANIVQLLTMIAIALVQFLINKSITFKATKQP